MNRLIWLLLVLLVVGLGAEAQLGQRDGNALLENCNQAIRSMEEGIETFGPVQQAQAVACYGYVIGFRDGHAVTSYIKGNRGHYCTQDRPVTHGQFVRVIVKWLKDHPEKLDLDQSVIVLAAAIKAFPCPDQK